jgi:predicted transcriptional regulator
MQSTTIRVSLKTRKRLRAISAKTGESMQAIVDRALEEMWQRDFWKRTNAAFAALRRDPGAWNSEQEERSAWDATLADE